MKLLNFTAIFCAITMANISCETNNLGDTGDTTICSTEYKTISVRVSSADGTPVKLDSITVKEAATGKTAAPTLDADLISIYNEQGYYPIVSDNARKKLQETPSTFTFAGYANGEIIANTTLKIGADDCHITLLSGTTEIVL